MNAPIDGKGAFTSFGDVTADVCARLRRLGAERFIRYEEHRWDVEQFRRRQRHLAAISAVQIVFYALLPHPLFACLAVLCMQTAAVEARRMCAVGRYYRTNRSLEVIGE